MNFWRRAWPSRRASAFFQLPTAGAIRHLFRVVSGLDSMVLGETEILGQVKKAYAAASAGGTTVEAPEQAFPARLQRGQGRADEYQHHARRGERGLGGGGTRGEDFRPALDVPRDDPRARGKRAN